MVANAVEKAQEHSQSLQDSHFRLGCSRTMSFEGDGESNANIYESVLSRRKVEAKTEASTAGWVLWPEQ